MILQINYNFFIKIREINSLTNLGNKYLDKIYTIMVINKKVNIVWFIKKKGTNCGIFVKWKLSIY